MRDADPARALHESVFVLLSALSAGTASTQLTRFALAWPQIPEAWRHVAFEVTLPPNPDFPGNSLPCSLIGTS